MEYQRAIDAAVTGDFAALNAMIFKKFGFGDFAALYQHFLRESSDQRRILALSLLISKLQGQEARRFAFSVNIADIEEVEDPALLSVLGRFIHRLYKLSGCQISLSSRQLLLAFLQYQQSIPEEYINMVSGISTPLEAEIAHKITLREMKCVDEIPEMLQHFLRLLPKSHSIVCNLAAQEKAALGSVFAQFVQLQDERKFTYLKIVFDSRFLISQPQIVFNLAESSCQALAGSLSQLTQTNAEEYYSFFSDLLLILSNFPENDIILAQLLATFSSYCLFTVSPGSEQFWQAAAKYVKVGTHIEHVVPDIMNRPLPAQLQCICNIYSTDLRSNYALDVCLRCIEAFLSNEVKLECAMCACYLISQLDMPMTDEITYICLQFAQKLIFLFQQDWRLLFQENVYEYYDFTQLTPAGTCKQLISLIIRGNVTLDTVEVFIKQGYRIPAIPLYELITYAALNDYVQEILTELPDDVRFLLLCSVHSIEYEKECCFGIPKIGSVPQLSDLEIAYLMQLFSNEYFGSELSFIIIDLLSRPINNAELGGLVIEAVSEVLPSLIYDSSNNIVLHNIEAVVAYLQREPYSDDYLRVIQELYGCTEEDQRAIPLVSPVFTQELLSYISPYLSTEQVIVRMCYDILVALTRFGIDTCKTYVAVFIDYIENTVPDTRRSVYEVAGAMAHLENEQIVLVISTAVTEYQGGVSSDIAGRLATIEDMDHVVAYRRDVLSTVLPQICRLLQE